MSEWQMSIKQITNRQMAKMWRPGPVIKFEFFCQIAQFSTSTEPLGAKKKANQRLRDFDMRNCSDKEDAIGKSVPAHAAPNSAEKSVLFATQPTMVQSARFWPFWPLSGL